MLRRHEKPLRRVYAGGRVVWVARWTDRAGQRHSAGTFDLRGPCRSPSPAGSPYGVECCAQHAIDAAYDREAHQPRTRGNTVEIYAETWLERRPRAERTNKSYRQRLGKTLDIVLDGKPFRRWRMDDVKRRQALDIADHLLRVQGRAQKGAIGVLRVLSAMWQDALDDEYAEFNPFIGVKIKASDPRIRKAPRAIRVYSWEEMHRFAAAAGQSRGMVISPNELFPEGHVSPPTLMARWRRSYAEAMVRVLSDCGLRLGELLALERPNVGIPGRCFCALEVPHLHVLQTAHEGVITSGTKTDHGEAAPGRVAPLPETVRAMLDALPRSISAGWPDLLWPTPTGKVWRESLFYREVWWRTQRDTGLMVRPHEMRHSWITHLRAAGINPDQLADAAGHTVATQHAHYTHPQGTMFEQMNRAVDEAR